MSEVETFVFEKRMCFRWMENGEERNWSCGTEFAQSFDPDQDEQTPGANEVRIPKPVLDELLRWLQEIRK